MSTEPRVESESTTQLQDPAPNSSNDFHQPPKRIVLLKVKRATAAETTNPPSFLSLQRVVSKMEPYPEDMVFEEGRNRSIRDRYEQQNKKDSNELVSLFDSLAVGNTTPKSLDNSYNVNHLPHLVAQQQQLELPLPNPPNSHHIHHSSGYIPPSSAAATVDNLTESQEVLRQRYNIPTPSSLESHSNSNPLSSNSLFKRVGTAVHNDITIDSLHNWYQENIRTFAHDSPQLNKERIAIFEVSTLQNIAERISHESILFQQQQLLSPSSLFLSPHSTSPSELSKPTQTENIVASKSSMMNLTGIQPFRDQNYVPKTNMTRATQLSQHAPHQLSTDNSIYSSPSTPISGQTSSIPGLKPPPPRRNGLNREKNVQVPPLTDENNNPKHTGFLNTSQPSSAQFLDADTLAYIEHRRIQAHIEDTDNGKATLTTYQSSLENKEIHSTNTTAYLNDSNCDDDLYDIYELCVDIATEVQDKLYQSIQNKEQIEKDVAFVLPNYEVNYLLARAQFDGFDALSRNFKIFTTNLTNFSNIHDEFVNQFTKPRLQQFHIDNFFDGSSHMIHKSGLHKENNFDLDAEVYEAGYYDDDYHPDFDSDMDYPDNDDDQENSNDDDDDDISYGHTSQTNFQLEQKKKPFVSMFDKFQQSQRRGCDDDENDDYDTTSENDIFRYGGRSHDKMKKKHHPNQNNDDDIELDAEDPMIREFILTQQMKYQQNIRKSMQIHSTNGVTMYGNEELHRLPGQNGPIDDDSDTYYGNDGEKSQFICADDEFCGDDERNEFGIHDTISDDDVAGGEANSDLQNDNETQDKDQNNKKTVNFASLMQESDDDNVHRSNQRPFLQNSFDDDVNGFDDDNDDNLDGDDILFKQFGQLGQFGQQSEQNEDLYGGSNAFAQFKKGRAVNYD